MKAKTARTIRAKNTKKRAAASKDGKRRVTKKASVEFASAAKARAAKAAATKAVPTKARSNKAQVTGQKAATKAPAVTSPAAAPEEEKRAKYVAPEIEKKWQERWEADHLWHTDLQNTTNKFYFLTMYPYPSGDLHIGHWYAMAPSDTKVRYLRMTGRNVFFPIGFDAFGLPAENAAIKRGIHPYKWTMDNIANMRRQLHTMGASFDWEREVVTCDPRYYKWNQWFFIQMYKRGLAYKKMAAVDWCPKDQTVLAREQVVGPERLCERCDTPVIKKDLEQWFLKITAYADELLDFAHVDWPEKVKTLQTNWIGRSEGVQFTMRVADSNASFDVFTTRQDTVFGMSFAVLAPEHPLVEQITTPNRKAEVDAYVFKARRETEIDRLSTEKVRDGVFTGAYAINPMNGARVPIWIADYVLTTYGTGAIMGVPAHDERDFDFARRYGLAIPVVVAPPNWNGQPLDAAYTGEGTMVNSGAFNGIDSEKAKVEIAKVMEERGIGKRTVNYRIRDWLISRQRYWGTPIPVVYCPEHGIQTVPENELPVVLPLEGVEFMPTGQSPLTKNKAFEYGKCPICGKPARRETDTMDTFVDSSWYQYDYVDPYNTHEPINRGKVEKWLPVDQYTGGVEHAVMHLLYTRFWTKVMRDIGLVDFNEPMLRLFNQGTILTGGMRMSKSRGNVVAPDTYVQTLGADTVRVYLMFIGPWDQGGDWDDSGIGGVHRWLQRVWTLVMDTAGGGNSAGRGGAAAAVPPGDERELRRRTHQTIKRVTEDMEGFRFNTMVAALMEFTNYLQKARETAAANTTAWKEAIDALLLMLAPSAPHLAEELWQRIGGPYSIHQQAWPKWDPKVAAEEMMTLAVQVNGKVRDRIELPAGADEAQVKEAALGSANVQRYLEGRAPAQVIYVPGRLVSIVVT